LSLNGHFEHYRFFPFALPDVTAADFLLASTNFSGTLGYSVGCHSGLNVPDTAESPASQRPDWPQVFAGRNALWVGNTGYGYGDSDLIAYSERLMDELGYLQDPGDKLGMLDAYLPEFADLRCMAQYDRYHIYTVDEHTLHGVRFIERLRLGEFKAEHPQLTEAAREVDDIALGVLYLASDAASFVTGKVLEIDGGIEAPNLDMHLPDL